MAKSIEQLAAERYPDDITYHDAWVTTAKRTAFLDGYREAERTAGAETEKLHRFLQFRDDFICAHGLWHEFMDALAAPTLGKERAAGADRAAVIKECIAAINRHNGLHPSSDGDCDCPAVLRALAAPANAGKGG